MPTYSVVQEAVRRAVVSSTLDASAGREPRDGRILFDVEALTRVLTLTRTPEGLLAVVAACEEEAGSRARSWIEAGEAAKMDATAPTVVESWARALAAVLLKDRVEG